MSEDFKLNQLYAYKQEDRKKINHLLRVQGGGFILDIQR